MRALPILLSTFLLAGPVSAQIFQDHFNYPNGTIVPGWTKHVGGWGIKNGRLYGTGSGWRYITHLGFQTKDCVLDGEFFFAGSGIQFGGFVARYPGSGTTNLVMCKIQNNGGNQDFDRCFLYEQPGGAIYKDIPGGTLSAYCRFIVLDNKGWMLVDANKDGVYEMTLGPKTFTKVLGSGRVGMSSYGATEMDNFKYFNAVLMSAPGNVPKIGTTFKMHFRAPKSSTPATPYFCMASLSNKGIPLGPITIPLGFDPLIPLSLSAPSIFMKFNGVLDSNGDAFPSIKIPNNPAFVGAAIFVAGFTIDPKAPFSIGAVSNDHRIVFQP